MRIFESEAHFIRECAYQDYLRFSTGFGSSNSETCRYLSRARNLEVIANTLDPQGKYVFHVRMYKELFFEENMCIEDEDIF